MAVCVDSSSVVHLEFTLTASWLGEPSFLTGETYFNMLPSISRPFSYRYEKVNVGFWGFYFIFFKIFTYLAAPGLSCIM